MTNVKNFKVLFLLLIGAALTLPACRKDDDDATEQENITTVILHFTNSAGFDQRFEWEDIDGDGGMAPVIDDIQLAPNTTYNVAIHVEDRSKNPVEDITEEIEEEDEEHLFTFAVTGANLTATYKDTDENGKPVGLSTDMTTGAASTGSLTVRLYHEPEDKDNTAAPGGEIDVEVTFPVRIQ